MGPVKVLSKMPRVAPAKTEPEDEFLSGLHHDPLPPSLDDFASSNDTFILAPSRPRLPPCQERAIQWFLSVRF